MVTQSHVVSVLVVFTINSRGTYRSQRMKLSINDRTEKPIFRRLHHLRHTAGISLEAFHALHPGDQLFQSIALVSVGEPPP